MNTSDVSTGDAKRPELGSLDGGIEQAIANADQQWWDGGMRALRDLAETRRPFTADDLRRDPISLPEPDHSARWGALFCAARRLGIITPLGWASAQTASRRRGVHRVWIGAPRATQVSAGRAP